MILINQKLELENVLSYRGKMTREQITQKMNEFGIFLNKHNISRGSMVTATHKIINETKLPILDFEFFCSIDPITDIPEGYVFKPRFRLSNALKLTHYGNAQLLQSSIQKLADYIKENGYMTVTSLYNVTVVEPKTITNTDEMQVDLYIGVTDNIL